MADFTCHQPPKGPCAEQIVSFNQTKVNVIVCQISVGDTIAHEFDDTGFFISTPTDCFDGPLPIGFHFGDKKCTKRINAKDTGVVVMIFIDLKTFKPYLEFLIVNQVGPVSKDIAAKEIEAFVESLNN